MENQKRKGCFTKRFYKETRRTCKNYKTMPSCIWSHIHSMFGKALLSKYNPHFSFSISDTSMNNQFVKGYGAAMERVMNVRHLIIFQHLMELNADTIWFVFALSIFICHQHIFQWCLEGSCVQNTKKWMDCKDINSKTCSKYSTSKLKHYCKSKDFREICCRTCAKKGKIY